MTDSEALETADCVVIHHLSQSPLMSRFDLCLRLTKRGVGSAQAASTVERLLDSGLFRTAYKDWKFFEPEWGEYFDGRTPIYTEYKP